MSDAGSVKTGGQYPLAPPPLRKLTERTLLFPSVFKCPASFPIKVLELPIVFE
jgi:hypothetical protein